MSFSSKQGDVYPVESYESFSANQILDAHWGVITDNDVSSCILFTLNYLALEMICIKFHPSFQMKLIVANS
jgi:hypothetical protein